MESSDTSWQASVVFWQLVCDACGKPVDYLLAGKALNNAERSAVRYAGDRARTNGKWKMVVIYGGFSVPLTNLLVKNRVAWLE